MSYDSFYTSLMMTTQRGPHAGMFAKDFEGLSRVFQKNINNCVIEFTEKGYKKTENFEHNIVLLSF